MPARHAPRLTPIGPRSSERNPPLALATMRGRQRAKIREFRGALAAAGLPTLDKQAAVLMLSRSTTWNLLKGKHKGSGISAATINRMLLSPRPCLISCSQSGPAGGRAAGDGRQIFRGSMPGMLPSEVRDGKRTGGFHPSLARRLIAARPTSVIRRCIGLPRPSVCAVASPVISR